MTDRPTSRLPRASKTSDATATPRAPRRSRVAAPTQDTTEATTTATTPKTAPKARPSRTKAATPNVVEPEVTDVEADEPDEDDEAPKRKVSRTSSQRHLRAVGGKAKGKGDSDDEENTPPPAPEPPEGMGVHGKRLWRDVVEKFVFRPDELVVLASACYAEERVHDIRVELAKMDILVRGSMGQLVANPLLTEVRAHEGHVATMLAKLKLKDVEAGSAGGRSEGARTAARARWATPHGAPS